MIWRAKRISFELSGLFARAVQHEYDHLDGMLFIDRLSPSGLRPSKRISTTWRRNSRAIASGG